MNPEIVFAILVKEAMLRKLAGPAEAAAIMAKLKATAKPRPVIAVPGFRAQQEMGEAPGYGQLATNHAGIKAQAVGDASRARAGALADRLKKAPAVASTMSAARRLGGR